MYTNQSKCKNPLHKLSCNTPSYFFYLPLIILFFTTTASEAQNAVLSGGKTVSNANYSLSYSIGELSVATYKNTDMALTQGQQQGNLIVTSLNGLEDSGIEAKAYPNPTSNFIMLSVEGNSVDDLEFSLTNINGRLLLAKKNISQQQRISMSEYVSGIYFLTVSNRKNNYIHTFKIIKQ